MSDIKWIKLSVGMFDDEKIKLIRTLPEGDSIVIIWVQILCLAGKINDGGAVYMGQNLPYSDEMLATILDHPPTTMTLALRTLEDFGMIDRYGDGQKNIEVTNWEKHQSTDKMAQIKQQNRVRQQKHYYRSKLRQLNIDVDSKDFPNDLESIKEIYEQAEEEPNVRLTLPNATEVRGKKKEVRGKKKESNSPAKAEQVPYKQIIDYLNEKADRSFNSNAKGNQDLIRARWNEGYTLEDFKQAIDNKVAHAKDPKHFFEEQYLTPNTLFRPSNFDKYVNEVVYTKKAKVEDKGADIDELERMMNL